MGSEVAESKAAVSKEPDVRVKKRSWAKFIIVVLAAGVVFGAGWEVGSGNLSWRSYNEQTNKNLPADLNYSSVEQVYDLLKQNFDGSLSQEKLISGLKSGLVNASGDPYTEFFNPEEAKQFNEALSGSFSGIGAELGKDNDGNIIVISPLSGYPAEKAGLKPQDIVAAVNGQPTQGQTIDSVVKKIRGPEGTKVTLRLVRGSAAPFDVTIARAKITVASVEFKVDGTIGYLKISQFRDDTLERSQSAVREFKAQGVKGVVLDLRGDPGGYLSSAIDISSLWLEEGKVVVQEKRGGKVVDTERANGDNPLRGLPTVVLINNGSASASEITAGALRDNGVATLVGSKTFGKGSVQQVINLSDGSELKVTTAHWYTPGGKNIDKQGIEPDVKVSINDADEDAGRDPQKDKAYEILRGKISLSYSLSL
jgi:carboxyl-terminal processing protease